ncbi:hypothetical protein EA462_12785 [Natrarchaeobius halalkaliphilus]|uniref:DUF4129 domain-containing protein n=1 Tax=Natrarchaeobius halalkaliphilus TaxID=1679091 RepID=A0A3N6LQI8_9EURY|nr:hypothetical protein [Natrarchaeobius halalkaliphilus]RQG89234.1 hypothetical protein EA462_12785 [Natrarchaeobius halalkaliphilus]
MNTETSGLILCVVVSVCLLAGVGLADPTAATSTGTPEVSSDRLVPSSIAPADSRSGDVNGTTSEPGTETEPQPDAHVNPEEYDEPGDREEIRAWLAESLSNELRQSLVHLERGEYDAATDRVDAEYRDRAEQYETIVDETGGSDRHEGTLDDSMPPSDAAFDRAGTSQRELIEAVETYGELEREYERSIDAGDEDAALEYARQLDVLAANVSGANESLHVQLSALETVSDVDTEAMSSLAGAIDRQIERDQADVRSDQFVRTAVTAEAADNSATVLEPVEITGTVHVEDGNESDDTESGTVSWPDDEPIRIDINGEEHVARDHEDGRFSVDYRPDPLAPAADELEVRYRPAPGVDHLGNDTTVPVSVEPIEPSVAELEVGDEVAYDESISVSGELLAGDVLVDGAPVIVSIGGTDLETIETTDGRIDGDVEMPASVPDGDRELTLRVDVDDRAIESTTDHSRIVVAERETVLSIRATPDDDPRVDGVLMTADGTPVADQPIELSVGGETVVVTTAPDGLFSETVSTSPTDEEVTVTATYQGDGSNLASTAARTTAGGNAGSISFPVFDRRTALIGSVVALALGVVSVGAWRLRGRVRRCRPDPGSVLESRSLSDSDGSSVADGDEPSSGAVSDRSASRTRCVADSSGSFDGDPVTELLTRASDHLSAGRPNDAVQSAYVAVRLELQPTVEDGHTLTHWEFQRRYTGSQTADLETLTEGYERAAFGYEPFSEETASDLLVDAYALVTFADEDASADLDDIVLEI